MCVLQITEWTHTLPDTVITHLFGKVSYLVLLYSGWLH